MNEEFQKNGMIVASEGKIILDEYMQDLISQYDKLPNEIMAETKVRFACWLHNTNQKVAYKLQLQL